MALRSARCSRPAGRADELCACGLRAGAQPARQGALCFVPAAAENEEVNPSSALTSRHILIPLATLSSQVSRDELVLSLRRQSKGFMRGTSKFRGVTRHQKGRWEARIGQLTGRKYRYLGLFDSEAEAAVMYDREAVRQRGLDAVTNFSITGESAARRKAKGRRLGEHACFFYFTRRLRRPRAMLFASAAYFVPALFAWAAFSSRK